MDELDPGQMMAALGFAGPVSAAPVRGGADAAIWRVERAGEVYALRLFRPEQAAQVRREVAAIGAAAAGGVPVPRVCATGTWRERPAILLAWCPGRHLGQELIADPGRAFALGGQFGRVQAAIHALPAPAALGGDPVPWVAWAAPDEALRALLAAVAPRPAVLLHLDYHPLNVMVEDGRLAAVLDWANARPGDPRADLARTVSILRLGPLPPEQPPATARRLRRALEAGWRRGYEAVARSAFPGSGELAPFLAWAGAVMERDLAPRLGRPDLPWLTPAYLARVRRWTAGWRSRARRA